MEHTIATDTAALLAEVDALLAAGAALDARVDALLAQPVALSITSQLAAMHRGLAEHRARLDMIEAEQAAIAAQLDALELTD